MWRILGWKTKLRRRKKNCTFEALLDGVQDVYHSVSLSYLPGTCLECTPASLHPAGLNFPWRNQYMQQGPVCVPCLDQYEGRMLREKPWTSQDAGWNKLSWEASPENLLPSATHITLHLTEVDKRFQGQTSASLGPRAVAQRVCTLCAPHFWVWGSNANESLRDKSSFLYCLSGVILFCLNYRRTWGACGIELWVQGPQDVQHRIGSVCQEFYILKKEEAKG